MHRRSYIRSAFSLLELLIVVGVLVLLLAIIVPVLQRAREGAYACLHA